MRWASVLALTVRVDATHSLGDAPPGNGTALPLALAAVRLLAMQIHGCVDVSSGDLGKVAGVRCAVKGVMHRETTLLRCGRMPRLTTLLR